MTWTSRSTQLRGLGVLSGSLAALLAAAPAVAQSPVTAPEFAVVPVAEKVVERLPAGPLYWRVESFASLDAAKAAAGPLGLAAEVSGRAWLLTLGPKGSSTPGALKLAEIGPTPVAPAARYMLRVNRAGGPAGAKTPVHTHPGSEAFYVIRGQLSQKTSHGVATLNAGQAMNGHAPGMVMQLTSSGEEPLEQIVMFVVDPAKPFSTPAKFD